MRAGYMEHMEPIFTRPIRATHIKDAPQTHVITAEEPERTALAALYDLPGIALLRGEFLLRHARGGIIGATLRMQAKITQTCVVTLEPFETRLDEETELYFVPVSTLPESEAAELDPETLEGPDEIPYANDQLDLGAALAEQLALVLDPYPRKPGAELPAEFTQAPENPFAVLKFKPKDKKI
jgi:uncharacterized metal-binding protein YceD (DUF177 family)